MAHAFGLAIRSELPVRGLLAGTEPTRGVELAQLEEEPSAQTWRIAAPGHGE